MKIAPGSSGSSVNEELGNRALLDKIDKLRELGISSQIPLPQMVVVGDQSAGKSSVLESLTGFHFPRSVTLCTRHATEIICRREESSSITISIVPHDADKEKEKLVREFRRTATSLSDEGEVSKIFEAAQEIMGIKATSDEKSAGSAFSKDVLRVEISGPKEVHLTVIDVPGMFENETPGLTTMSDVDLVKNMVKGYIQESRTIILAVIPCTGDIANQKILTFAREADPEGKRTLGVLTKPDLAVENATKQVVVDLVKGKRRDLHLGYCVVKNRGADDKNSSPEDRQRKEATFFADAPWRTLPADRLGIPALRKLLQNLLTDRTKSEFPTVRIEINTRLKSKKELLRHLGKPRVNAEQQRAYLGKVADRFSQLKEYALDAYYTRDKVFFDNPSLKLITRIRELNERYARTMYEKGHLQKFAEIGVEDEPEKADGLASDDEPQRREAVYSSELSFTIPEDDEDELDGLLTDPYACEDPIKWGILKYIEGQYLDSRGYELATFGGDIIRGIFREQSKKWSSITLAHVSNVVLVIHSFIRGIIENACPDSIIREDLWAFLSEDLLDRYQAARGHAEFLLEVEFEGRSLTYNPAYRAAMEGAKVALVEHLSKSAASKQAEESNAQDSLKPKESTDGVLNTVLKGLVGLTTSDEEASAATQREIHNGLKAYYEVALGRFVDVVCQQVIDHYLLHSHTGPLAVLTSSSVLAMTPDQLDAIAGEDMASRGKREQLEKGIEVLAQANKILRA